ncbi:MAG: integrase family protein [Cellvibrionaceae bacterium]
MAKLTKSYIDRLPIPEKKPDGKATQAIYRDESLVGFGLLVGSGGTKSFFVERRVNGRVKRISLGRYGHLTPQQAKLKAQEMLGEIAMGNDPVAKKKAYQAQSITLQQSFDDYLDTRKSLKPRTVKDYQACMGCYLPDWQSKRMIDITKDMVEARHKEIGKRTEAKANNTMRILRAVFNHAIAKYEDDSGDSILTVNPVDRLSKNRAWYKVERKRSLIKAHELSGWYQATLKLNNEVSRDYLHFLLFTGLRKMEAATLRWDQVSFEDRTFTICDTKNSEPHTLPLTDYLIELLHRRKSENSSPWVFKSPLSDGHIREPRGSVDKITKYLGKPFALHDLRRTFITIAESLDIPAYALKRLVNHKDSGDVTAGYIVSDVERIRLPMSKISNFISLSIGCCDE